MPPRGDRAAGKGVVPVRWEPQETGPGCLLPYRASFLAGRDKKPAALVCFAGEFFYSRGNQGKTRESTEIPYGTHGRARVSTKYLAQGGA